MNKIKMLHMAGGRSQFAVDGPLAKALREHGELEIVERAKNLTDEQALERMREADVLITMWGARAIPPALADEPGRVRYILHLTGTLRPYIPIEIIRSPILVTNWGDTPAFAVAEGAVALLMAVLKDLRPRTKHIEQGEWAGAKRWGMASGTMRGLRIGLYGCGVIGQRFVKLITPFGPDCTVFDPYAAELPESCKRVDSLEALFDRSEAIVVWAGLTTDQTRGSVTAELLAKLPDQGIVINAARGAIIDQDALFAELKAGRLRAGLDVLDSGDSLPPDHEARHWPNLVLTCHDVNSAHWPPRPPQLGYSDKVALANLKRFLAGEPLRFVMDERRYKLST